MPTSVHWINVSESLRAAIATHLSVQVERRYTAYFDKQDVVAGKYLVVGSAAELAGKRGVDHLDLSIDVGYQRALPEPSPDFPDPLNNVPWLDAEAAKVQAIKDLFAAEDELGTEGPLRAMSFAGATYVRWTNNPLYRPDLLIGNQIFTSVIRFEFRIED